VPNSEVKGLTGLRGEIRFPAQGPFLDLSDLSSNFEQLVAFSIKINREVLVDLNPHSIGNLDDIWRGVLKDFQGRGLRLSLETSGITQYLDLQSWTSSLLNRGSKKKLRRLKEFGFKFRTVENGYFEAVFDVLVQNRLAKEISIEGRRALHSQQLAAFPSTYSLAVVEDPHGKIVASSICVEISKAQVYVFMWGELPECRTFSPVVLLAEGLANNFRGLGFDYLDLGTSSVGVTVDPGLFRFKANLGAKPMDKVTAHLVPICISDRA